MIRKFLVAVIGMAAFVPGFSQSTSEVKADTTASTTETKPAPEEVKPTTTINVELTSTGVTISQKLKQITSRVLPILTTHLNWAWQP